MTTATTTADASGKRRGQERRRSPRYRCLTECLVRLEGAAEPLDWPGIVYNISATGVALALPFPAPRGMVLVIEPRRRCSPEMRVRARVVRSGLRQYVWYHGAEFLTPLAAEEFERWRAELSGSRISEG